MTDLPQPDAPQRDDDAAATIDELLGVDATRSTDPSGAAPDRAGADDTADADAPAEHVGPDAPGATDATDAPEGDEHDAHGELLEVDEDPEERAERDPRTPGQLLTDLERSEHLQHEYLDQLQRLQAEFDNFRRRSRLEAQNAHASGVAWLATKLLEVVDDLDRTLAVGGDADDEGLAVGVRAVHRKLLDTFSAAGVTRVEQADVPFDANVHEAVQQVPADPPVEAPVVDQVLRPGYVHGDRCLRAAMVVVRQ